jgi:limonene-1,2-epoxide hydrolase
MKPSLKSNDVKSNDVMMGGSTPQRIVQSVLAALSRKEISVAIDQFDDHFTFNDRALGLEFSDKEGLREYFVKVRELFPDTAIEVVSTLASGDSAVAEWKVTATRPTSYGSLELRLPISLPGASIARIQRGRIKYWSDYYDEKTSMRLTLASFFVQWIDY